MSNCHFDECKIGIQQRNLVHSELALQMIVLSNTTTVRNVDFN